jgi:hypothetical protein
MYDFTKVSKKTIDNDVRIETQINESLDKYYKEQKALREAEETRKNEAAMSAARFTYASTTARSNERVKALTETIKYNEMASVYGMTEMVSEIVEKALLLDEEELVKMQPEYKAEIRDIVSKLLKEGEINENITNPDTLAIMEYVSRTLPDAKDGKYLTEDDLYNLIMASRPADMDEALAKFSGDVSHKVATLMEKEQKRVKELDAERPAAEEAPVESAVEGEVPAEEVPVEEVPAEEVPAEEEVPMDAVVAPKKQIQMLPDGTLNVNIFESKFVRETPRSGLIESLSVNEAQNMLARGEEYNADLCLAKAIEYVTIMEAMDSLGLMEVGNEAYSKVISAAGGKLLESKKAKTLSKKVDVEPVSITESVIATQWKPTLNAPTTDFAERIRQKKLLQEAQSHNLNE